MEQIEGSVLAKYIVFENLPSINTVTGQKVEGSKYEDLVEIVHAIASKNKELGKSFDDIKAKFEFYEKDNELL